MALNAGDSAIYSNMLGDDFVAQCFSDEVAIEAIIKVEIALAKVQAKLDIIPKSASDSIARHLPEVRLDAKALAEPTAAAGVVMPPLVAALRAALPKDAATYLHFGATSQDIVDTATLLQLRPVTDELEARLDRAVSQLSRLADRHRATVVAARTRFQQASPTSFGLKVALWRAPLKRALNQLKSIKTRVLKVQFGGAAGNLSALGKQGIAVMDGLADELQLTRSAPWHTDRESIAEFSSWLALLTGSLGKMATDLIAMARSEVGEVRPGPGGGSSTLPQKANPVYPEAIITLSRMNAHLAGAMFTAMTQEHERDGIGWAMEWLALPQMLGNAAGALRHTQTILDDFGVNADRMLANIEASNGLVLAEAASFALAAHMPRPEAQALVKSACKQANAQKLHLLDVLAGQTESPVDWDALRAGEGTLGRSDELIDRLLADD